MRKGKSRIVCRRRRRVWGLQVARDFARTFYKSKQWEDTRNAYMRMGDGLCEPCLRNGDYVPAEIVHHKIHLSPDNINDPEVTLSFKNLERVCRKCHAESHPRYMESWMSLAASPSIRTETSSDVRRRDGKDG